MRRRTLLATVGGALPAPALVATPLRAEPGSGAAPAATAPRATAPFAMAVDVLLILAVDVSRSMDEEEARLQREGYAAALSSPLVHEAIGSGAVGAIGLAYLEWSGPEHQVLVLPWTRIDGAAAARASAARLSSAPLAIGTWTSIATALDRARALMSLAPFLAERRVIDVSGDGVNNAGGGVEEARDRAVAAGIVINGLPVMKDVPPAYLGPTPTKPLDEYYRESVVGGFGAFVLPAEDYRSFGMAVRRKLVREIAALPGPMVG